MHLSEEMPLQEISAMTVPAMDRDSKIDFEVECCRMAQELFEIIESSASMTTKKPFVERMMKLIDSIAARVEEQTIQRCYRILMTEKGGIERLYSSAQDGGKGE